MIAELMRARRVRLSAALAVVVVTVATADDKKPTLVEARKDFKTQLRPDFKSDRTSAEDPPASAPFRKVTYEASPGKLPAYLTPDPKDGKKHPAIVWITGGDCNSIGDVWSEAKPDNDQTAAAFRKAGIVMMFPSLRGGNDNPGKQEGFLGEVDDVLAAAKHLAAQSYVDPKRLYLGGHSTGGTLVLLVAAAAPADIFRAIFSFGPVDDVNHYPDQYVPFVRKKEELEVRAPARFTHCIKTPTFVFEGTDRPANGAALQEIKRTTQNALVKCFAVKGATHFTILAPTNAALAKKVLADDAASACNIAFTEDELSAPFAGKPGDK